jgi:hypothetical protein
MPFINVDGINDVPEEHPVKDDAYDLTIMEVVTTGKDGDPLVSEEKGYPMVRCMVRIDGREGEDAPPMFHYLVFPLPDTEERIRKLMIRNVKRFLHTFGVEWNPSGFEADDLQGATANKIRVKQTERENGDIQNEMVLPRLPEDRG